MEDTAKEEVMQRIKSRVEEVWSTQRHADRQQSTNVK